MERKSPYQFQAPVRQLKSAPASANKRAIGEKFAKQTKSTPTPKTHRAGALQTENEPVWHLQSSVSRNLASSVLAAEISPLSNFADELRLLPAR